jgi:hypothetical protein
MTAAEAIALAKKRGGALGVFLGKLRVYSEDEPDEILVRLLRDNKQAVDALLAAETEPHRWRRVLAEKTQTIMQLRGMTRPDAEHEAFKHVLIEYLNATHPDTDPTRRCRSDGAPVMRGFTATARIFGAKGAVRPRSRSSANWAPWREAMLLLFRLSRRHRKHILLDQLRVRPERDAETRGDLGR